MVEAVKNQKRYEYADIFKALCMFLVIVGHAPLCSSQLQKLIYAFHMPAFFFIYGLVYSAESHARRGFISRIFVTAKAKRLILPFFCWAFIYTMFSGSITIRKILLLIWGSQSALRKAGSLTSLWFLPCMFITVIIFEVFLKYLRKSNNSLSVIGAGLLAGIGLSVLIPKVGNGYIWSADVSAMGFCFCLLGFCLQKQINKSARMNIGTKLMIALLSIGVCFLLNRFNLGFISIENADMASRNYGNCFLYIIAALAGCVSLIFVSMCISDLKIKAVTAVLENIGKYTLSMLALHKPMVISLCTALSGTKLENWVGGLAAACIVFAILTVCIEIWSSLVRKIKMHHITL